MRIGKVLLFIRPVVYPVIDVRSFWISKSHMKLISSVKGVLFDLDGVLYVDSEAIAGAVEAVERIRASGISCRFVTNTSTLSLDSLRSKIASIGFSIAKDEIISAPQAALLYLKEQGDPACRLLLADDVKTDFAAIRQSETDVDYIVVGDIGAGWAYPLMNEVFHCLMNGAKLIAIHKNRFWQTGCGLQMDIGGFIDALEYASGVKAMLIGKPAKDFFRMAVRDMGLDPAEVVMIGDDIDADVGGAQQAGLGGILVRTGKYRRSYAAFSAVKPDLVIDSVKDLPFVLGL
jgi:HAD superfamily hydrolase (TIGR01458 family)